MITLDLGRKVSCLEPSLMEILSQVYLFDMHSPKNLQLCELLNLCSQLSFSVPPLAGLGSTGCGRDIQNYILKETWFTKLVLVTTGKIGSLHRWSGTLIQLLTSFFVWLPVIFSILENNN